MYRFRIFLFWFGLLLAFFLGGIKASLDQGGHYFLRMAQHYLNAQQVDLQIEKIGFSFPAHLKIKQLQLNSIYHWPLKIEHIYLGSLLELIPLKQLPNQFNFIFQAISLEIPNEYLPVPFIIKALGYEPYFISPAELKQLATEQIQGDLHIQLQTKQEQLTLTMQFESENWGQWQLQIILEQATDLSNGFESILHQAKLSYLKLNYQDNGLLNRWLNFVAHRQGISATALKQQLQQQLQSDLQRSTAPDFVFNRLERFIQQSDSLTVYLQPPNALTLKQISQTDPNILSHQLGFSMQ